MSMQRHKIRLDGKVRAANFNETDLVWLLEETVGKSLCKKFARRWRGPYKILKKLNDVDYEIRPIKNKGRKKIVHQTKLKRCFVKRVSNINDSVNDDTLSINNRRFNGKTLSAEPKRLVLEPSPENKSNYTAELSSNNLDDFAPEYFFDRQSNDCEHAPTVDSNGSDNISNFLSINDNNSNDVDVNQ